MEWNRILGRPLEDGPYSVLQTSDGGYAVAGLITLSGGGAYDG